MLFKREVSFQARNASAPFNIACNMASVPAKEILSASGS